LAPENQWSPARRWVDWKRQPESNVILVRLPHFTRDDVTSLNSSVYDILYFFFHAEKPHISLLEAVHLPKDIICDSRATSQAKVYIQSVW
jgi:hypothetical protein